MTELLVIFLGKGKKAHLMIGDRGGLAEDDWHRDHVLCGREIGEGVTAADGVEALDDCCSNCVRVHDAKADGFCVSWE